QGFDLVARTLLDPGDFVAIEQPSYPRAMQVFRAFGAQLLPVPLAGGGLSVEHLERLLEPQGAQLPSCPPTAPHPTGPAQTGGAPSSPRSRRAPPAAHRGGRFRRHPLLRGAAAHAAQGGGRLGAGDLSRHFLEGALPRPAPRLDRRLARPDRAARDGEAARGYP